MKTSGIYSNCQLVKEQQGDILTYYHLDGKIKAQGKNIDSLFQGKWVFYKKVGFLWNVGHFKDHQKHGQWIRYHDNGSIEKDETFEMGNKVKKKS
jgi:antitoxin component YwqK of YwqJK toxin-antitoxin module